MTAIEELTRELARRKSAPPGGGTVASPPPVQPVEPRPEVHPDNVASVCAYYRLHGEWPADVAAWPHLRDAIEHEGRERGLLRPSCLPLY